MDNEKQRALATRVAESGTEVERQALLVWMLQLLQIRDSKLGVFEKGKRALFLTAESKVLWPIAKMLAQELKRIGWDERGTKTRWGLLVGSIAAVTLGGHGAGIAALGGAIGVPLWVVLGAGAYFAAGLIEDLRKSLPKSKQPQFRDGKWEVVEVEVREMKRDAG